MLALGTPLCRVILALGSSREADDANRLVRRYLTVVGSVEDEEDEELVDVRRIDHLRVPGEMSNECPKKSPVAALLWKENSWFTAVALLLAE
jgi:hypothetical protein